MLVRNGAMQFEVSKQLHSTCNERTCTTTRQNIQYLYNCQHPHTYADAPGSAAKITTLHRTADSKQLPNLKAMIKLEQDTVSSTTINSVTGLTLDTQHTTLMSTYAHNIRH